MKALGSVKLLLSNRAAGDLDTFTTQLPPGVAHTVEVEALAVDVCDLLTQIRIAFHSIGQTIRITLSGLRLVVRRWGDRQHVADRLDPVIVAMFVDKRH